MSDLHIYQKVDKYKSWSNLKKQMTELLCDALSDKITYFYTSYHSVHSAYGRATINYEKRELVAFSWDIGLFIQWEDEYKALRELSVQEKKTLGNVWNAQIHINEALMREKWMPNCTLCDSDFIQAVTVYLKKDIASALSSENYLLRVFAYMDRRVGKRTLVKIREVIESLPEWVQRFYRLRCEAEGLDLRQTRYPNAFEGH